MTPWRTTLPPARWLWLGVVALAWGVLQFAGPLGAGNDDDYYRKALLDRSLVSWLTEYYTIWSGRLGIDAVTLLVIPHAWLWRILNACMLGLLLWSVAAMLHREREASTALVVIAAAVLLDPKVWRETAWWMTGSFNYLWPAALGAFACLRFVRTEWPAWQFLLTVPAAVYACFQEQSATLVVAFQAILGLRLAWTKQLRWLHAFQLAVSLGALALLALAPGSATRFAAVVLRWFPEYGMLTVPERIFCGMQLAFGRAFVLSHGLGLLFALLLLRAGFVRRTEGLVRWMAGLPLLVLVLPAALVHALPAGAPGVEVARWMRHFLAAQAPYQDYWIGNAANAVDVRMYLSFAMGFGAAAAVAWSLYRIFRTEGPWPASLALLVWLASLASTTVLGLSPTLYLSSNRIFLMQDLLVLGLCAALSLHAFVPAAGPPRPAQVR